MRVAAVQMDVKIGAPEQNLASMLDAFGTARQNGAELVIFPECALTGYCFESAEESLPFAEELSGPAVSTFQKKLQELGGAAVFGMLTPSPDGVFNTAVLLNGDGVIGAYRKIHLPGLGIDQYATYGDEPFRVYEVGEIRVGLAICYDSAFPESSRVMALQGADLIALPTNFPTGAENMTRYTINTRAMENKVYFAAVNRVGKERGFRFIGETTVADPNGNTLCKGSETAEEILYFDVDPAESREKRIVRVPGKHAIDRVADRRPEMYGSLVEPHNLPRPGRE
ncbi:carbon-nitrogen hydrolase family protein [Thalassoglobus sp. JC818]|uniref:carbon-nitrogen hydrolase family protein n=1 Tax=Thalassoglobus sp. JC818 TaxID=3232136 RepID=UPI00345A32A1